MKKSGKVFGVLLFIIVLIFALVFGAVTYINTIFSHIKIENIDKEALAVNSKIYDEVNASLDTNIDKESFNKVINVALFGTDSRNPDSMESGRADTIMVASINPINKSIKLISIPRDTYVKVEEYGYTKINHSYAYGKEQLAINTINSNFGLNITEYATIDFSGLIHIINNIGGVSVEITEQEKNYINERSNEAYEISGNKYVKVENAGKVVLSGEQALTHSRNRTIGNDFVRAGRQRKVLEALLNKLTSLEVEDILNLSNDFLKEVKTNININEYIPLLASVLINKDSYIQNIISKQIPNEDYSSSKMIKGVYYFVCDLEDAKKDFYKTIYEN